jgi:hypothetical protein
MIIDLGINSENSILTLAKSYSLKEMEIYQKLFWVIFGRFYSIVPSSIHEFLLIIIDSLR